MIKLAIAGVDLGYSYPLGAWVDDKRVNFSVYSKHARAIELLRRADGQPRRWLDTAPSCRVEARSTVYLISGAV